MEDFGERAKALAWRGGMRHAQSGVHWRRRALPVEVGRGEPARGHAVHPGLLARLRAPLAAGASLFGESWQEAFQRWKSWLRKSGPRA